MSPFNMVAFFAMCLGYALAGTAALALLIGLAGRRPRTADMALVAAVLLVLALALLPLPDLARLECGQAPLPRLKLLGFLDETARLAARNAPLRAWLTDITLVTTVMNVALFAPVGLALAWRGLRWPAAAGLAMGLTAGIELAQLTGLFGLYPCAWRTFDIDDLWLNTLGVMAGHWLGQRLRPQRHGDV